MPHSLPEPVPDHPPPRDVTPEDVGAFAPTDECLIELAEQNRKALDALVAEQARQRSLGLGG